ncbi:MAG TPA: prolyl oligopeptidase family serine peptidase [Gemmatimonadales bacterium]|nr:prolyl oligopeptidase family serine peptidase [Gemmatimonadales bacterium]
MRRLRRLTVPFAVLAGPVTAQSPARLTPELLLSVPVPSDPRVSPDGHLVAFTVTTVEGPALAERRRVWLLDLDRGESWQATGGDGEEWAPRWSPDGATLGFVSTRSGRPEVWALPTRGGEPRRLTGAGLALLDFEYLGGGRPLLGVADVPAADAGAPVTNRPWRAGTDWRLAERRHLFLLPTDGGPPTDVTPGPRNVPRLDATPPGFTVTALGTEVAWAGSMPGGETDVITMGPDGSGVQALTQGVGPETRPAYSPDSRFLAYLQGERTGHPSGRRALVLYERAAGRRFSLTGDWDRSVEAFAWSADSRRVVVEVMETGARALYTIEVGSGRRTPLVTDGHNTDARPARGGRIVFIRSTAGAPPELFSVGEGGGGLRQLTRLGAALAPLQLSRTEQLWVRAPSGDSLQVLLQRPVGAADRRPLLVLLGEGPGAAWSDGWEPLWNAALFAARGWLVARPNLHGAAGYGEAFTSAAWRQPTGPPGADLLRVLDALSVRPDVDPGRVVLAGSGQGAGLALWTAGQGGRFVGIVAHAPVVDAVAHAGTTTAGNLEETYGGGPLEPAARTAMERSSALNFAARWSTPVLLTHGTADNVVDVSQSLAALSLLADRGLERGLLLLPGEGHVPAGAASRLRWWTSVTEWLENRFSSGR